MNKHPFNYIPLFTNCLNCNKKIKTTPARVKAKRGRYCSKNCLYSRKDIVAWNKGKKLSQFTREASARWNGGKPKCLDCNKELSHYVGKRCNECFRKFNKGENHYNWQGGRQKHGDGYIQIYKPEHLSSDKRGRIMEHRYVLEIKLGRLLKDDEHIHHINGIKTDNRIKNLLILSNKEHLELHWRESDFNNFKNSKKTWIKKGQHLSVQTEFI